MTIYEYICKECGKALEYTFRLEEEQTVPFDCLACGALLSVRRNWQGVGLLRENIRAVPRG